MTNINKDGNESVVTILHYSARFMTTSLSSLVDNLAERIHEIKCKNCHCFLEYESERTI